MGTSAKVIANWAAVSFGWKISIWEELVRDAPRYAQFQAFLDTVKKDLSGLDNDPTANL